MMRQPKKCRQCGREIYFDGICASCQEENERNEILVLTEEEIADKIRQICNEIITNGALDKAENLFKKLLNYRDIDTSKIAETAFKQTVFIPVNYIRTLPMMW